MIETIPEQSNVSKTVPDRIREEVTVLIRIPEITVETVIQTEFNSEKKVDGFFGDNQQDGINLN